MKKFIDNLMGVSAVFSTLTLIAVAVIAGSVVWIFTSETASALIEGETVGVEMVVVHGFTLVVGADGTADSLDIYAQSICKTDVTINSIVIKDLAGVTVDVINGLSCTLDASGRLTIVSPANIVDLTGAYAAMNYYTVTLISAKGSGFTSLSTRAY